MKTMTKTLIIATLALATLGQAQAAGHRQQSHETGRQHNQPIIAVHPGYRDRGRWAYQRHHHYRVAKGHWNRHDGWRNHRYSHRYSHRYDYRQSRSSGAIIFRW